MVLLHYMWTGSAFPPWNSKKEEAVTSLQNSSMSDTQTGWCSWSIHTHVRSELFWTWQLVVISPGSDKGRGRGERHRTWLHWNVVRTSKMVGNCSLKCRLSHDNLSLFSTLVGCFIMLDDKEGNQHWTWCGYGGVKDNACGRLVLYAQVHCIFVAAGRCFLQVQVSD